MSVSSPDAGRGTARRSVWIVGRGKVGRALAREARQAGLEARCLSSRGPVPRRSPSLIVLAVPDGAVAAIGARWAAAAPPSAMVHTAGLLPADHLAPLRDLGWHVGQGHPLASFAGVQRTTLRGVTMLVDGDPLARRRASSFARSLGMSPVSLPDLARPAWHAVAALVANGAAGLVAVGKASWTDAGVPARLAERALAALLASVASNIAAVGLPRALSGPVRRGDVGAVRRHLEALSGDVGGGAAYAAMALAQLPLARALGEAAPGALEGIEAAATEVLRAEARRPVRRPVPPAGRRPEGPPPKRQPRKR